MKLHQLYMMKAHAMSRGRNSAARRIQRAIARRIAVIGGAA